MVSSRVLVGDDLDIVGVLLVVGEHDGDAVREGEVLPCDGGAGAALVPPDCADLGPDFLGALGTFAVVDEVGGGVGHGGGMGTSPL